MTRYLGLSSGDVFTHLSAVDADFHQRHLHVAWASAQNSVWVPRVSISKDRKKKLPISKAWACKLAEHHFCRAQSREEGHRSSPLIEKYQRIGGLCYKNELYPYLSVSYQPF